MNIHYILTMFSPAMVGDAASIHIRRLSLSQAQELITDTSQIVANRISHELLARKLFPNAHPEVGRFANLKPGVNVLHIHYRGAPLDDSGIIPPDSTITIYLIETEEYLQPT